jgi:cephalosporin hydroxylase
MGMIPRRSKTLRSTLRKKDLQSIQRGTLSYTYKGIPCLKDPFDLAIYPLLISKLKPRTIIEIGSAYGGSALWFRDLIRNLEVPSKIFSFDINPVKNLEIDGVEFLFGDIHSLHESNLPDILATCERPLLVIEDGPHTYEGCKSALEFFHPFMSTGDYIVIEDGIVYELGLDDYLDGPNQAITEHLRKNSNCLVDREFCDYYGQNFTWSTNGYLKYGSADE